MHPIFEQIFKPFFKPFKPMNPPTEQIDELINLEEETIPPVEKGFDNDGDGVDD